MARKTTAQINIRSALVRERVAQLAADTGKTMTQVVEDAVSAYRPPPPAEYEPAPDGFVRKGWLLIQKARPDQRKLTLEQHLAIIDEAREDRIRHILGEDVD